MFDIRHLENGESISADCHVSLEIPKAYGALQRVAGINVSGSITRAGESYIANCGCDTEVTLECALCLSPVVVPLRFDLVENFSENNADGSDDVWPVDDKTIDLTTVLESYLFSMIPVKPVCGDSCKGLCRCGKNLNDGPCGCED